MTFRLRNLHVQIHTDDLMPKVSHVTPRMIQHHLGGTVLGIAKRNVALIADVSVEDLISATVLSFSRPSSCAGLFLVEGFLSACRESSSCQGTSSHRKLLGLRAEGQWTCRRIASCRWIPSRRRIPFCCQIPVVKKLFVVESFRPPRLLFLWRVLFSVKSLLLVESCIIV